MLKSHYAPQAELYLGDILKLHSLHQGPATRYLVFQEKYASISADHQHILAPSGEVKEAAQRLFDLLRQLDEDPDCQIILAEKVPHQGLGLAINDRLDRAQSKFKGMV